jgi:4,5-dihydroxyphthalate decarboxylase
MAGLPIRLVTNDFDFLAPLALGEVVAEGVDLRFERRADALDHTLADGSVDAGELSFARHVARLAVDDRSFVGLPFFPHRAFRHRCFFVRRGSELSGLADLAGRRVGTNEWPATGNTWSRAALREQGVAIEGMRWWVGSVDGAPSNRPQGVLPPYVQPCPPDRTLLELLLAGELDALMCPKPPRGFRDPSGPVVRLLPDYRLVEQAYYRRTGVYPAHHIVGVRRELFERQPRMALSLYRALDGSVRRWAAESRPLAELTPWMLAELEEIDGLMGTGWRANGVEPNHRMIQTLCDELHAQGLVERRLEASALFAEFEAVASLG